MSDEVNADLKFSILPEWVLDSEATHKAIRVYAVLARFADSETLQAWPSRATIAEKARMTVRSVDAALAELENLGMLSKQHRVEDNRYTSSLYVIRRVPPGGAKIARGVVQNLHGVVQKTAHRTITKELEPLELERERAFTEFWDSYPHKMDKARARKAFGKLTKANRLEAIEGAKRFAADPNLPPKRFIPYPATWLNGERWNDGPLPARTAKGETISRASENEARLRELLGGK